MTVGQKIKLFRPGVGTFHATIDSVMSHPSNAQATDSRGGFYTYRGDSTWNGPKNEIYWELDEENNIKNSKVHYMKGS